MVTDEHQALRLKVAEANGFSLYRVYFEKEFCAFVSIEASTAKRWRKKGVVPYISLAGGGIRYLGLQIADVLILGKDACELWPDTQTALGVESGTSGSGEDGITAPASSTENASRLRLALNALNKPNKP